MSAKATTAESKTGSKAPAALEIQSRPESPSSEASSPRNSESASGDSANSGVKHPLQNAWVLYYDSPAPKQSANKGVWQSNIKKIGAFDTVEGFWSLFNNLQPPSALGMKCDYYLFKEGYQPDWDDPKQKNGGRWVIDVDRKNTEGLNKSWTFAVLAMIGEQYEDGEDICGTVVNIRNKRNRLNLWTRTSTDADLQKRLGEAFKRVVELEGPLQYEQHHGPKDAPPLYEL